MSRFGDVDEEPVTFLASRALVAMTVTVVLAAGVFDDPLWFAVAYGFAVGASFAIASFLLRRTLG